ncbi:MAG TPA: ATP-dependent DNA helicase RecG [Micropepsaceae bacterium]|nr:ATP-dependent DNA helicase RecG [Micropepsaceae bacterium]
MRPAILNRLFAESRVLPGIGPKIEKLIAKALGTGARAPRVLDLVFHLPAGLIDRRYRPKLIAAEPGRIATVTVNVLDHKPAVRGRRLPYRVLTTDDTAAMEIVYFTPHEDHILKMLPPGSRRTLSGRIDSFSGRLQMAHPDYIAPPEDAGTIPDVEAVYPTTEALSARVMGKAVRHALERLPELPEWQDESYRAKQGWPNFASALGAVHGPQSEKDLEPLSAPRMRLAYDELLANQLALALIRDSVRRQPGRVLKSLGALRRKAFSALPFQLTEAQTKAILEITADMESPSRMVRLLQGDVGAGKTVVAMAALLNAVEAGYQGAFMAPTEILARQHLASLEGMAKAAGVRVALLTGRERGAPRSAILAALEAGEIDILVGTHAIFSEDVRFRDLALAVVDEQHRFGVHQRMQLQGKGERPADVLVMTATPIPRTLQLTAYGDMDVSRLTGKPPGRRPVETRVLPASRLDEVIEALKRALAKGARAYWVCPLVEESEKSDLAAAEERAAALRKVLGPKVGLVHGRMKGAERDAAMAAFKMGETRVLVATTVIEVGVDVPEASIIVVEHAERFGLAQLHQLRGRVGRGAARSTCLLVYHGPLGPTAKQRLAALRSTDDGFVIAEEDLRLRGAGELLGTKQSGLPEFHFADLSLHGELLAAARDDVRLILQRDGGLKSARGEALRTLLYLFEQDEAVRYLRTG